VSNKKAVAEAQKALEQWNQVTDAFGVDRNLNEGQQLGKLLAVARQLKTFEEEHEALNAKYGRTSWGRTLQHLLLVDTDGTPSVVLPEELKEVGVPNRWLLGGKLRPKAAAKRLEELTPLLVEVYQQSVQDGTVEELVECFKNSSSPDLLQDSLAEYREPEPVKEAEEEVPVGDYRYRVKGAWNDELVCPLFDWAETVDLQVSVTDAEARNNCEDNWCQRYGAKPDGGAWVVYLLRSYLGLGRSVKDHNSTVERAYNALSGKLVANYKLPNRERHNYTLAEVESLWSEVRADFEQAFAGTAANKK
jgi:hypothetical protein